MGRLTAQPGANFVSVAVSICVGSTYSQALRRGGCASPFRRPITVSTVRASLRVATMWNAPSDPRSDFFVAASSRSMTVRASSDHGPFEAWQGRPGGGFGRGAEGGGGGGGGGARVRAGGG